MAGVTLLKATVAGATVLEVTGAGAMMAGETTVEIAVEVAAASDLGCRAFRPG